MPTLCHPRSPLLARPLRATLALALALAGLVAAQAPLPRVPFLPGDPALEAALLAESNAARIEHGRPTLAADEGLALAARHHAREMADLGYFSHGSPTPENATLHARLSRAGVPAVTVAENLAQLRGQPNLAVAAVDGWLESPGHRANLLEARFDRVGFGTAVNGAGETIVVQVLAYAPLELLRVESDDGWRVDWRIDVHLRADAEVETVLLALGDAPGAVHRLTDGAGTVTLRSADPDLQQLRVGVPMASGSYVLEASAWVTPETGAWSPDASLPGGRVRIEDVAVRAEQTLRSQLRFSYPARPGGGADELALFVGEEHVPGARVAPGVLEVSLPHDRPATIHIGETDGRHVTIFHAFRFDPEGGPRLRAGLGAP